MGQEACYSPIIISYHIMVRKMGWVGSGGVFSCACTGELCRSADLADWGLQILLGCKLFR